MHCPSVYCGLSQSGFAGCTPLVREHVLPTAGSGRGRQIKQGQERSRESGLEEVTLGGNSNINENKKMSYKLTLVEYLMYMRHLIIVLFNPFNNPMN